MWRSLSAMVAIAVIGLPLPSMAMECMDHAYFISTSAADVGLCASHLGLLSLYGSGSVPASSLSGNLPQMQPGPVFNYQVPSQSPSLGQPNNAVNSYALPDPSTQPVYGEPYKPTPKQMIAAAEASLSPATIKRMQVALIVKGYDPGAVSGHLSRETLVAVMVVQKSLGMTVTGLPDNRFIKAIGVGL